MDEINVVPDQPKPNIEGAYQLIAELLSYQRPLIINRRLVTITGDLASALLLGEIMYRCNLTPDGWYAQSYSEWSRELKISEVQVKRAVKNLKQFGVVTQVKQSQRHQGAPVLHYAINWDMLLGYMEAYANE